MSDNTSLPDHVRFEFKGPKGTPEFIHLELVPTLNGVPLSVTGETVDLAQQAIEQASPGCKHRFNLMNLHRGIEDKDGIRSYVYFNLCLDCLKAVEVAREVIDRMNVIQRHQIPDE